ncbi:MAG: DUF3006 domain-containing protein [Sphaerochaetaceae bacterium]|jgi:hypothetical protein
MSVIYKVERFEEDFAVCNTSDGRTIEIPFEDIPEDSVVGTQLRFVDGKYVKEDF